MQFRGGAWVFNLRKGQSTANVTCMFRIKSTVPTTKLLQSVEMEFNKMGGSYLNVKPNQSLSTENCAMMLFVSTSMGREIARELTDLMLNKANEIVKSYEMEDEDEATDSSHCITYSVRFNKPRLPKSETTSKSKSKASKEEVITKALHYEVATDDKPEFMTLVSVSKQNKLDKLIFGPHAHLTGTLTNDASIGESTRLRRYISAHANFQISTTSVTWQGFSNLEAEHTLVNPVSGEVIAVVTFRQLANDYTTPDGLKPFLQLYQQSNGDVVTIIPNIPEAETSGEMAASNPAAFFSSYCKQVKKMDRDFVNKLMERTFDAKMIHDAAKCTFCPNSHVLTTPEGRAEKEQLHVIENLPWIKDLKNSSTAVQAKEYANPEAMFNFGEEFSHKTLHDQGRSGGKSDSRPTHASDGTPIIYLSKKKKSDEGQCPNHQIKCRHA